MINLLEDKPKEECGLVGGFNLKKGLQEIFNGLHALQHRGQDAAGMAWEQKKKIESFKAPGLLENAFKNFDISEIKTTHGIGHVRYATSGDQNIANIHPFVFKNGRKDFALAHNGNISNAPELRKELEKMGTVFWGNSDTESLGHFLVRSKEDLFDALIEILPKFEGAFCFLLVDKNAIYAVRDKIGFKPLVIGRKDDGYVVASETVALDIIGATFIRDVKPGEIIKISNQGIESRFYARTPKKIGLDAMELIYFARPDSILDGVNVHSFRKNSGKLLAKEAPAPKADIVVPILDSAISAALGYSEISGIPFELGLIKNRYIARTFIDVNQKAREIGVQKKLNTSPLVNGKNVVLIDDSIVRGTTLKQIVEMLKKAGAKRIDLRIASPKIIAPSYYGINISTYKELIAHNLKTEKDIAKVLKADSLAFLSIDALKSLAPNLDIETCIFTNEYRTPISNKLKREALK